MQGMIQNGMRGAYGAACFSALILWQCCTSFALAQIVDESHEGGRALYMSSALHKGFIIIHSRDIRAVEDSYPTGFEFDIGWRNTSNEAWQSCLCTPHIGLSLGYWDFDNPSILGRGFLTQFFVEPHFAVASNLSFALRAGLGLSYQNRPHHPINNPDNLSYSTRLAFPLHAGAKLQYALSPSWAAYGEARYNHISNGGIRQPNKGINWPTASLGVAYFPKAAPIEHREKIHWREYAEPQERLDLFLFGTWIEPDRDIYVGSGGAELRYAKQIARLSAIQLSTEWMYHGLYPYRARQEGNNQVHGWMGGLAAGHSFLLGRFLFSQQMGVYLLKPENEKRDVYQRYGLMYLLDSKWSVGVYLKAHGHVADFLDMRIAYNFLP